MYDEHLCLHCKYLCRIDCGYIYCKKYYKGKYLLTSVSDLSFCAKFKPKKKEKADE